MTPQNLGSITPLDLGFDPRVHQMTVELQLGAEADTVTITYDCHGSSRSATGDPVSVERKLRAAGYRVRWTRV